MARKMDSPCMFCGGLPCTCDGGTKKKSSPRTRKVASTKAAISTTETSPTSTPPSPSTEADTEDVFGEIPTTKSRFKNAPSLDSERDLSYESALRSVLDLLSGPSRREAEKELHRPYPQAVDRRVAAWKGKMKR